MGRGGSKNYSQIIGQDMAANRSSSGICCSFSSSTYGSTSSGSGIGFGVKSGAEMGDSLGLIIELKLSARGRSVRLMGCVVHFCRGQLRKFSKLVYSNREYSNLVYNQFGIFQISIYQSGMHYIIAHAILEYSTSAHTKIELFRIGICLNGIYSVLANAIPEWVFLGFRCYMEYSGLLYANFEYPVNSTYQFGIIVPRLSQQQPERIPLHAEIWGFEPNIGF